MKHVNHDTNGNEYRVYSALPGCACAWCTQQRKEHRLRASEARTYKQDDDASQEEAGTELHRLTEDYMRTSGEKSYAMALRKVAADNPTLLKDYNEPTHDATKSYGLPTTPEQAGEQLAALAKARASKERLPYEQALRQVLKENPELADLYDKIGTPAQYR